MKRDFVDAVMVGEQPVKIPWRSRIVSFDKALMPAFMVHLSLHRWYWPVATFQFFSWAVTFFSPYATVRLV